MSRFEKATFVSTNDGLALAGSNCDHVYFGSATGLTFLEPPCIDIPEPPGDQSEVSAFYRDRAFEYMGDNLGRVPVVAAARIGRTWNLWRPLDMLYYNLAEGKERFANIAALVTFYPLALLAIAGGWILLRKRRGTLWPLVIPAVTVTIGVAITYGQTRFRSAAEPSLVILSAFALASFWDTRFRKRLAIVGSVPAGIARRLRRRERRARGAANTRGAPVQGERARQSRPFHAG